MWIVFLLFILIIGILSSTIEANLYKLELTEKKFDLKVVMFFKLFGIIKIARVNFNESEIQILNKKITYKEIIEKLKREDIKIKKIDFNLVKIFFESININWKKIYFTLKIGLVEMAFTNIVVILFSSLFPFLIKSKTNNKNFKYEVLPDYNNFCIKFNGRIAISVKFNDLIKLYFKNIKPEITHNKNKNYDVKESC